MSHSPTLLLHILSGTIGMLSGFVAVFLLKGSRRHSIAGTVFAVSMLSLGATGAYMAIVKSQPGNILGGLLTLYLVSTAWITAKRKGSEKETGIFDWIALCVILAITSVELTSGVKAMLSPTGLQYGYPPGIFFMMGSVALIATVGDIRMLARRSISGPQRIARHLWRMCFSLFIAAASIFLARAQLFPSIMQKTGSLVFLSVLPLLLMIFWLIRVLTMKQRAIRIRARKSSPQPNAVAAVVRA